jgi:hypothetical protein
VASSTPARLSPPAKAPIARTPKKTPPKEPTPDNRLFVRLPNSHAARDMQGYAVLTSLRTNLGTDGPLLKDVQTTKTGFALCPTTPDALAALEARKDIISGFFGQCLVERSSYWVSYRVTNVPRRVGQITGDCKQTLIPVDAQTIAHTVLEATRIAPVSVTETTYSVSNPTLPYSCWFVNFPEGTPTTIPRQLHLFGTVATATYLPRKTTIVQCSRCWMWHNARSCARPPRCRLCGTTEHTEEGHNNRCDTPAPYICPPRCIHCHGPYPADHTDCSLRRRTGNSPTKLQISAIRSSGSAKSLRTRMEAGCTHTQPTDHPTDQSTDQPTDQMAIDPAIAIETTLTIAPTPSPRAPTPTFTPRVSFSPTRPSTPSSAAPPQQAPSTTRATCSEDRPISPVTSNRFDILRSSQL